MPRSHNADNVVCCPQNGNHAPPFPIPGTRAEGILLFEIALVFNLPLMSSLSFSFVFAFAFCREQNKYNVEKGVEVKELNVLKVI